jgi:predicted nucleic acid-binding protein
VPGKALVIDANILVRAVLGRRVREIIETYAEQASFFVPEVAYAEAEEHLPALVVKRGGDPDKALRFLRSLRDLVDLIGSEVYGDFEITARERLGDRDPEDWPILATALAIGCPIWTEDNDFFGCGVATWTTSRVVVFLREPLEVAQKYIGIRQGPCAPVPSRLDRTIAAGLVTTYYVVFHASRHRHHRLHLRRRARGRSVPG